MNTPWTVTHNSWEVSTVYDAKGDVVAEIPIDGNVDEDTQDALEAIKDARAHLIAAAPDLLEALRVLLADCEDYEPWQRPCRAVDLARAALAKARGQS